MFSRVHLQNFPMLGIASQRPPMPGPRLSIIKKTFKKLILKNILGVRHKQKFAETIRITNVQPHFEFPDAIFLEQSRNFSEFAVGILRTIKRNYWHFYTQSQLQ